MKIFVSVIQIIIAIILSGLVLLQAQGSGLGSTFGGGGEFYRSKRGLERVFFRLTIIFTVLFLISSLANFMIQFK